VSEIAAFAEWLVCRLNETPKGADNHRFLCIPKAQMSFDWLEINNFIRQSKLEI
jgi:hypothetical protein